MSGLIRPAAGTITFEGESLVRRPAHKIVQLGMSHVPEGRAILKRMTVLDNLRMGAYVRRDKEIDADIDAVFARFPALAERRAQLAATLSGGEQQMLAIGRALVARPRLLLLDEPSLGLAPKFVTRILQTLTDLKREGKTILLVEQNARKALQIADFGYVMERGRIVLSGTGASLLDDPQVQQHLSGSACRARRRRAGRRRGCKHPAFRLGFLPARHPGNAENREFNLNVFLLGRAIR